MEMTVVWRGHMVTVIYVTLLLMTVFLSAEAGYTASYDVNGSHFLETYGHPIENSKTNVTGRLFRMWVDPSFSFPSGKPAVFHTYLRDNYKTYTNNSVDILWQIWEDVSSYVNKSASYELKFSERFPLPTMPGAHTFQVTTNPGKIYSRQPNKLHLGWAILADFINIPITFSRKVTTQFKILANLSSLPQIQDVKRMDAIHYPAIFPVAVTMQHYASPEQESTSHIPETTTLTEINTYAFSTKYTSAEVFLGD